MEKRTDWSRECEGWVDTGLLVEADDLGEEVDPAVEGAVDVGVEEDLLDLLLRDEAEHLVEGLELEGVEDDGGGLEDLEDEVLLEERDELLVVLVLCHEVVEALLGDAGDGEEVLLGLDEVVHLADSGRHEVEDVHLADDLQHLVPAGDGRALPEERAHRVLVDLLLVHDRDHQDVQHQVVQLLVDLVVLRLHLVRRLHRLLLVRQEVVVVRECLVQRVLRLLEDLRQELVVLQHVRRPEDPLPHRLQHQNRLQHLVRLVPHLQLHRRQHQLEPDAHVLVVRLRLRQVHVPRVLLQVDLLAVQVPHEPVDLVHAPLQLPLPLVLQAEVRDLPQRVEVDVLHLLVPFHVLHYRPVCFPEDPKCGFHLVLLVFDFWVEGHEEKVFSGFFVGELAYEGEFLELFDGVGLDFGVEEFFDFVSVFFEDVDECFRVLVLGHLAIGLEDFLELVLFFGAVESLVEPELDVGDHELVEVLDVSSD